MTPQTVESYAATRTAVEKLLEAFREEPQINPEIEKNCIWYIREGHEEEIRHTFTEPVQHHFEEKVKVRIRFCDGALHISFTDAKGNHFNLWLNQSGFKSGRNQKNLPFPEAEFCRWAEWTINGLWEKSVAFYSARYRTRPIEDIKITQQIKRLFTAVDPRRKTKVNGQMIMVDDLVYPVSISYSEEEPDKPHFYLGLHKKGEGEYSVALIKSDQNYWAHIDKRGKINYSDLLGKEKGKTSFPKADLINWLNQANEATRFKAEEEVNR